MSDKPLKVDQNSLPPGVKSTLDAAPDPRPGQIAANMAFADSVRASFDAAKPSLKVDPSTVRPRVSASSLPTKRYHVGCIPGAPFTTMYVANEDFPLTSHVRLPGSAQGREAQLVERLGTVKSWTDEQVASLMARSALDAWRSHAEAPKDGRERSSRWSHVPLDKQGAVFQPGDKLTANFIYIRPLAEGEDPVFGVLNQKGAYMAVPEPLLSDETKKTAAA